MTLWTRWVTWWAAHEPPEVLALFRILVAAIVLVDVGSMLWTPGVTDLFVAQGHGGLAPDHAGTWWWSAVGGSTPTHVVGLLAASVVVAGALLVGWGGRWVPLLLGQLLMAVFALHPGTGGGHDRLILNALWLFVLGRPTATWSLDARRATGRWTDPTPILALPRRLAVFQLILMYTLTGLEKQGAAWGPAGDWRAVYDALLLPSWARFDMTWIAEGFGMLQVATGVAWWWESTWVLVGVWMVFSRHPRCPAWLRRADLRLPYVLLGVLTHGILGVAMNLGPFSAITLAYYVCLLRPGDAPIPLGRRGEH